jgi:hypothetical protein
MCCPIFADPGSGIRCFLDPGWKKYPDPGSGMEKKFGSGIRNGKKNPDPRSFFLEHRNSFLVKTLKFFYADAAGSGIRDLFDHRSGIRMGKIRIRDPA